MSNYKDYENEVIYYNKGLYKVIKAYEGNVDLSYHGSPYYETFLEVQNLHTGEIKTLRSEQHKWCLALNHIEYLEKNLQKVKDVVRFI